jgi:hypothetical protein
LPKIERLYAFVAEDGPGDEGLMAFADNQWWIPMVGADFARVESLRKVADRISKKTGKRYRVLEFVLKGEMNG